MLKYAVDHQDFTPESAVTAIIISSLTNTNWRQHETYDNKDPLTTGILFNSYNLTYTCLPGFYFYFCSNTDWLSDWSMLTDWVTSWTLIGWCENTGGEDWTNGRAGREMRYAAVILTAVCGHLTISDITIYTTLHSFAEIKQQ